MKKTLLLLFPLCLLQGCVSFSYYHPTNAPLTRVKEKADLEIAGTTSSTEHFAGYTGQLAYALTDKYFIGGNGFFGVDTRQKLDRIMRDSAGNDIYHHYNFTSNSQYGEMFFGYYKNSSKYATLFVSGIGGLGKIKHSYIDRPDTMPTQTGYRENSYFKLSAMPGVNIHGSILELCLATRFSYVNFYNLKDQAPASVGTGFENDLSGIRSRPNRLFFEPVLELRLGYKNFKLCSQLGFSSVFGGRYRFNYDEISLSVGASMRIATKKKTKERTVEVR